MARPWLEAEALLSALPVLGDVVERYGIGQCNSAERIACRITLGGNWNPANPEGACTGGFEQRVLFI